MFFNKSNQRDPYYESIYHRCHELAKKTDFISLELSRINDKNCVKMREILIEIRPKVESLMRENRQLYYQIEQLYQSKLSKKYDGYALLQINRNIRESLPFFLRNVKELTKLADEQQVKNLRL